MPYLKQKRIGSGTYLYVVRSYRTSDGKVRNEVLQYLGRAQDWPQADAAAAVAHWNRCIERNVRPRRAR